MKSEDIDRCTCLQESQDGREPSSLQGGKQTDLFGAEAAPAPRSASPAERRTAHAAKAACLSGALDALATQYARTAATHGLPTPGTYGRKCGDSSPSADLQQSLASRLQAQLDVNGSPEYVLRWRSADMLLGPRICQLQASARRTSDSDISGWPTPAVTNAHRGGMPERMYGRRRNLQDAATLTGWGTPRSTDAGHSTGNPDRAHDRQSRLEDQVFLTGWATPAARDYRHANVQSYQDRSNSTKGEQLPNQVAHMLTGAAPPSCAPTESSDGSQPTSKAQLNPKFGLWLVGFPREWACCAGRVTR